MRLIYHFRLLMILCFFISEYLLFTKLLNSPDLSLPFSYWAQGIRFAFHWLNSVSSWAVKVADALFIELLLVELLLLFAWLFGVREFALELVLFCLFNELLPGWVELIVVFPVDLLEVVELLVDELVTVTELVDDIEVVFVCVEFTCV